MDSFEVNLERHERSGSWRLLTSKGHEGVFWEPREGDAKTEAEATVMWPWAETNQGCQNPSKMVTVKEGRSVRLPRGNVTLSPQILEPDFKNYEGIKKKFCCLEPPSLWELLEATTENWYTQPDLGSYPCLADLLDVIFSDDLSQLTEVALLSLSPNHNCHTIPVSTVTHVFILGMQ